MCRMLDGRNDTPEDELRAWLAAQLKFEDVPGPLWAYLQKRRYVAEVLNEDLPDGRNDLLAEAREQLRLFRALSDNPDGEKRRTKRRPRATIEQRAAAEAEFMAKVQEAAGDEKKIGGPTPGHPVIGRIQNNQITITADPWVPKEAVARKYADMRRMWFYGSTPSERQVELFKFVVGRSDGYYGEDEHGRGIWGLLRDGDGWRVKMDAWNDQYPEDHPWRFSDVRNFRRDFNTAFEALALH